MLDPYMLLEKDGSLTVGYYYHSSDFETSDKSELNDLTIKLNSAFDQFGSECATHFFAIRMECANYTKHKHNNFTTLATSLIDKERRKEFETKGNHYETILAFTVTYQKYL